MLVDRGFTLRRFYLFFIMDTWQHNNNGTYHYKKLRISRPLLPTKKNLVAKNDIWRPKKISSLKVDTITD